MSKSISFEIITKNLYLFKSIYTLKFFGAG